MGQVHFSPKALVGLIVFLLVFALLIDLDHGSGPLSRAWPSLMLIGMLGATAVIYRRMWRARNDPGELGKAEAQSLYGVLPEKLRNWIFP
jgi:hypothetical protein